MTDIELEYSPEEQKISSLVDQCEVDWGDPELNRKLLLPYGVLPLDMALYGLDIINGEIVVVQGPEKQRKSTFVANVIAHFMQNPKVTNPPTMIDVLESGMNPKRYRDTIISIVATQLILHAGHLPRQACPNCETPICQHFGITPEFLRFNTRTKVQADAISAAKAIVREWPLWVYGVNAKEGGTRNLITSVIGTPKKISRWKHMIDLYGIRVIAVDHLQQYSLAGQGRNLSDYEKQDMVVAAHSDIVAGEKIAELLVSQISLTSQREATQGTGKYYATGGKKAAAEAATILSVNYESLSGEVCITIEDSRKSSTISVYQPLEDTSGAFYGKAIQGDKAGHRPGMEEGIKEGAKAKWGKKEK